jgi:GNAT superfamily N-acetyltransferase
MMRGMLHWSLHDTPDAGLLDAVDTGLDAHNMAFAPLAQVRPLACAVHSDQAKLLGGAVGRTWGACVELQQLWVDEHWRGQGLATGLMQRFEAQALARDCRLAYLETFSFQAPGFYQRQGYAVASRIEGFGEGIFKLLMTKTLG